MLGDNNPIRQETIEVAVRIRPLHPREILNHQESIWTTERQPNPSGANYDNTGAVMIQQTKHAELIYLRKIPPGQKTQYAFNRCFDASVSNQIVYEQVVKRIAVSSLQGINGTIFMYGQTGSGKTYTMMGGGGGPASASSATNQQDGKSPAQSSQSSSSTTLQQQQQQQALQLGSFPSDARGQQQQPYSMPRGLYFQSQQDSLRSEKSPRKVKGSNSSVSPIRRNIHTDSTIINNNNNKHAVGTSSHPGILELSLQDIFKQMAEAPARQYLLRCSYVEIYMDFVYDLLQTRDRLGETLQIGEDQSCLITCITFWLLFENDFRLLQQREFFVKGAVEETVGSIEEILELLRYGESNRHYASTAMNHISSRSHTVFRLCLRSMPANFSKSNSSDITESILNFVDLAGSEKISIHSSPANASSNSASTSKDRQIESKTINKSLFFLTQVINLKSSGKPEQFIPYRNSPLTKILRSSLGGNSRTGIILCLNPCVEQLEQSMSTLRFGNQASYIQNTIKQNYIRDENALSKLVDEYQTRIRILEAETTHTRDDSEILIKAIQELMQQKKELERQLKGVEMQKGRWRREDERDQEQMKADEDDCILIKNVGIVNVNRQTRRVQRELGCKNTQPSLLKECERDSISLKASLLALGDSPAERLSGLSAAELKELEIITMMLISNIRLAQKKTTGGQGGLLKDEVEDRKQGSERAHRQLKNQKGIEDQKKKKYTNYDADEIERQLSLFKKVESPRGYNGGNGGGHSPRIQQISQKPSSDRNTLEGSSMLLTGMASSNSNSCTGQNNYNNNMSSINRYPEQKLQQQYPYQRSFENSNEPYNHILPATSSNTPLLQSFIVDKTAQGVSSTAGLGAGGEVLGGYKKLEESSIETNSMIKDIIKSNNSISNMMMYPSSSQAMSLLSGVSNNNSMANSSAAMVIIPNRNASGTYFNNIIEGTTTTATTATPAQTNQSSNKNIQQAQPYPQSQSIKPFFETRSITNQISQFFNSNTKDNNNNSSSDLIPSIAITTTAVVNPLATVSSSSLSAATTASQTMIKPQIRSCSQGGNRFGCLKINDINTQASALQQDFQDSSSSSTVFGTVASAANNSSASKRINITQMKKESLMNSFTKALPQSSGLVSAASIVVPQSRFIIDKCFEKENVSNKGVQSLGGQNGNNEQLGLFGLTQRTLPLKQSNRNTFKDHKQYNNSSSQLHKQQQQQIFQTHQSICSHLTISKNASMRDMQQAVKMQLTNTNNNNNNNTNPLNMSGSSSSQTPKSAFKQVISKFSQQQIN